MQPVRQKYTFACILILYKEEYVLGILLNILQFVIYYSPRGGHISTAFVFLLQF